MKRFIYLLNYKTYFTFRGFQTFVEENKKEWAALAQEKSVSFVCAPSFELLWYAKNELPFIALGAQDCSAFEPGAYTGQVTAQSLKELGCDLVINGHYEVQLYCHEVEPLRKAKLLHAQKAGLTTAYCIGARLDAHATISEQAESIKQELAPLIELKQQLTSLFVCIEPAQAIGAHTLDATYYSSIEQLLYTVYWYLKNNGINAQLLYGGTVNEETAAYLKNIPFLDGFMIGRASCDFQQLKKIVLS